MLCGKWLTVRKLKKRRVIFMRFAVADSEKNI